MLVPFYVSYRAAVRAKVNGIKASAPELSASEQTKAQADARAQWLLALGAIEECRGRPAWCSWAVYPARASRRLPRRSQIMRASR